MATFATEGSIGADLANKSTTPLFALGSTVLGSDGRTWMYVKATETIATDGDTIVSSTTYFATAGSGIFTTRIAGGASAVVANDYYWAQKDLT